MPLDIQNISGLVTILLPVLGVLATVFGIAYKYLTNQYKLEAMRITGEAFKDVVGRLDSNKDEVSRLAAAVLLRRFFDESTEFGRYYAQAAKDVIASVLRREPEGSIVQKVLADGLAYAGNLKKADLQETNLTRAYWGERVQDVDLSEADLYKARLTGASLRGATANGTIFNGADLSEVKLVGAKLRGADFRGATLVKTNFSGADLTGALFDGATLQENRFDNAVLTGASFRDATNVPAEIHKRLDAEGKFR